MLGNSGILSVARRGLIVVDHSTISPTATKKMNEALGARGAASGCAGQRWRRGAKNATLSIMVGGDESAFNRVRPLLAQMGKTITYCGPSGSGQLTKLVNQILVSVTNLAVCEALAFAEKSGLDPQKTLAAVSGGAAGSWQLSNLGPKMIAGDFCPGFMIKLQHKDLRLAIAAAREAGIDLTALDLVYKLFDRGLRKGRGDEGTQALFAVVKETIGETDAR